MLDNWLYSLLVKTRLELILGRISLSLISSAQAVQINRLLKLIRAELDRHFRLLYKGCYCDVFN